ncbi:MAG: acyltransferase [Methanobacterium sp.]|nr:acyltransferase [Methanobacterium sp.]
MRSDGSFAINNFTVLRLALALLVVLGHFKAFAGVFSPPWPFSYAAMAVESFFVISGYLVTDSFDRDPNIKRFLIKRFCRIYPLYLTVVVAQTILLSHLAPPGSSVDPGAMARYLLANALFANFLQHDLGQGVLQGLVDPSLNASLWTLKIEFAFYLCVPFLWRAVRRYGPGLLIVLFFLSAFYQVALQHAGYPLLAKQLPGQLQYFLVGIAAYRFRHRVTMSRSAGVVAGIGLVFVATVLMQDRPPILYPLVGGALVIVLALSTPRVPLRLDVSYGVYLLHAPLIQLSLLFNLYRPGWDGVGAVVTIRGGLGGLVGRRLAPDGRRNGSAAPLPAGLPPPFPALLRFLRF